MDRRDMLAGFGAGAALLAGAGWAAAADPVGKLADTKDCCKRCVETCAKCMVECLRCYSHCAAMVGQGHKEHAACAEACLDCVEFCQLCLTICARQGAMMGICCEACAKACEACAKACAKFPDDKICTACAAVCKDCQKCCNECCKA